MKNSDKLPCGLTVNEIILELETKLKRIIATKEDRAERIANHQTDYDDCWRSIKSDHVSERILEDNLKLAKESGFKTTYTKIETMYAHPNYKSLGELRDGEYGEYVMFKKNNEKPLFVNPNAKTNRGLKGLVVFEIKTEIATFGEYVFDGRGGTLTSMGGSSFVTAESEDDYLRSNTSYIFYDDFADMMDLEAERQEELYWLDLD